MSVFGCPEEKLLQEERIWERLQGEYSDLVVITEEDHGEEDLHKICTEILTHASGRKAHCLIIEDREEAIQKAVSYYSSDAVVLLTGKGRETRQKRGTEYIETLSGCGYSREFTNFNEIEDISGRFYEKQRQSSSDIISQKRRMCFQLRNHRRTSITRSAVFKIINELKSRDLTNHSSQRIQAWE